MVFVSDICDEATKNDHLDAELQAELDTDRLEEQRIPHATSPNGPPPENTCDPLTKEVILGAVSCVCVGILPMGDLALNLLGISPFGKPGGFSRA